MERALIGEQLDLEWPRDLSLVLCYFCCALMMLYNVVHHRNIFANDKCVFIEGHAREEAIRLVDNDLFAISAWSNQSLVNFSHSKTMSRTISHTHAHFSHRLTYIEEVDSHNTYLGLRFATI